MMNFVKQNQDSICLTVDSGAFSAFKLKKNVNLEEYCNFILKNKDIIFKYFSLDVIGNPEKTRENLKIMLDKGLNPIPVFTRGDNPKYISDYYKNSDIIGIGGLVGTNAPKQQIKYLMENFCLNKKVHWLGYTGINLIKYYKPYMCDSSSWTYGARYGRVQIYDGEGDIENFLSPKIKNIKKKADFLTLIKLQNKFPEIQNFEDVFIKKGLIEKISASSWVERSIEVEERIGTKIFLVCTSLDMIKLLLNTYLDIQKFKEGTYR